MCRMEPSPSSQPLPASMASAPVFMASAPDSPSCLHPNRPCPYFHPPSSPLSLPPLEQLPYITNIHGVCLITLSCLPTPMPQTPCLFPPPPPQVLSALVELLSSCPTSDTDTLSRGLQAACLLVGSHSSLKQVAKDLGIEVRVGGHLRRQ